MPPQVHVGGFIRGYGIHEREPDHNRVIHQMAPSAESPSTRVRATRQRSAGAHALGPLPVGSPFEPAEKGVVFGQELCDIAGSVEVEQRSQVVHLDLYGM